MCHRCEWLEFDTHWVKHMILGHIDAVKFNHVWTTKQGHVFGNCGPSVSRLSLLIELAILLSETVVMVWNASPCFSDSEGGVSVSSTAAGSCCTTKVELTHYKMSCLSDANVTMGLCQYAENPLPLIFLQPYCGRKATKNSSFIE